jgi:serine protease Do
MRRFASILFISSLFLASCGRQPIKLLTSGAMYTFAAPSTAKIERLEGGSGSGFFVTTGSGRQVVVTNAHVCGQSGKTLRVRPDGNARAFLSSVLRISYRYDLCTLSVPKGGDVRSPSLIVAKERASLGTHVYAVGHPAGLPLSVTEGIIVARMKEPVGYPSSFCAPGLGEMIQDPLSGPFCGRDMESQVVTALVIPGNSGGPLLNEQGEVVGVVFATSPVGGAALPLRSLRHLLSLK